MTAPSIPPLCRYCGKALPKRTKTIIFGSTVPSISIGGWWQERPEHPHSKQEAQQLTNEQIVSVRRSANGSYISSVKTWDGESYREPYFCTNAHAIAFAHVIAKGGTATQAYYDARNTRLVKIAESLP